MVRPFTNCLRRSYEAARAHSDCTATTGVVTGRGPIQPANIAPTGGPVTRFREAGQRLAVSASVSIELAAEDAARKQ